MQDPGFDRNVSVCENTRIVVALRGSPLPFGSKIPDVKREMSARTVGGINTNAVSFPLQNPAALDRQVYSLAHNGRAAGLFPAAQGTVLQDERLR